MTKELVRICKCGQACQYYGPIGGFSIRCYACNKKNADRQVRQRKKYKDDMRFPGVSGYLAQRSRAK